MTPEYDLLHLASGAWELEVHPARGGAVTALRHRGKPVLVSPGPASADAMGAANFALLPYANRIARGHVEHRGRQWHLPRNFGEHAHSLHGTGWKRPWSVSAQSTDFIELALRHEADEHWPWAFTARQRISLMAEARFELHVTNTAPETAPMGLGFHPAFAACGATRLRTQVAGVWLIDADSLPLSLAPAGAVLPELPGTVPVLRRALVDHCFTEWSRELHIDNAGTHGNLSVTMIASPGMDFLQLYMPPGRAWFCAEPMSQMPDAIHRTGTEETGLRILAPGESMQAWMTLAVREPAAHG
ncbi:MAG: aldose 1-epimerase [Pseudomonadota bacterium]